MAERYISLAISALIILLVVSAWRLRKRRVTPGAAAAGSIYEMLNDERRAAVEIVLEERAAERDPEDRDGNLPDLERPTRNSRA